MEQDQITIEDQEKSKMSEEDPEKGPVYNQKYFNSFSNIHFIDSIQNNLVSPHPESTSSRKFETEPHQKRKKTHHVGVLFRQSGGQFLRL